MVQFEDQSQDGKMKLPLHGIRVLDLSRALAGPFCATILADLGAEVVKIEPGPDGEMVRGWGPFQDGISVYYLSIHRNKKSLSINFRDNNGIELIRRLSVNADVLIENFKPGVMETMGLSFDSLQKINPRLIQGSITGFGSSGPYGDWPGMDQIAQGMSGLMSITGQLGTGPTRVGIPIGDVVAGMWCALGIQAALFERSRTNLGQHVETSLLGGLIGLLTVQGQRQLSLGQVPEVAGNDHPVICPYGLFQAKDGPFNMAAATEDMWVKLCRLLGMEVWISDPKYSSNAARMENRESLKRDLNSRFLVRGKMEWTQELVKLGIPAGPIYTLDQVFQDPHVRQTGMVERIEHPTLGPIELASNPIKMEALRHGAIRTPPPLLGQDTRGVLGGLGLNDEEIDDLIRRNIVYTEK
jgi:crotonobetainyl-CoA:carnitine CoA-transferase CaiB-like acyl-CoA transferase